MNAAASPASRVRAMTIPELIKAAIEAHGGEARWNSLTAVEATVSAWGFLFTPKRRLLMRRVRAATLSRLSPRRRSERANRR